MSWISNNLLPAMAHVMRQHHDRPRVPATPKQLAGWLHANGHEAEGAFVMKILPGEGFDLLVSRALAMLEDSQ